MRRRLLWAGAPATFALAYWLLCTYADESRAMEAVLGLFHGNMLVSGAVAVGVIVMRIATYASIGGVLLAWPLDELLRARRSEESDTLRLLTRSS